MNMTLATRSEPVEPQPQSPNRGWAVAELRFDGTLGPAQLVLATNPVEAARTSGPGPERPPPWIDPALEVRLGLVHAAGGRLGKASRAFSRGLRESATPSASRSSAAQLALVEAYQGDLRNAEVHAEAALAGSPQDPRAEQNARLARACIHLERGELLAAGRWLELVEVPLDEQPEPWQATVRLVVKARLLIVTQRPDAAVRLLREQPLAATTGSGWAAGVLSSLRAEALLEAGEPARALAELTPLPPGAVADSSVVIAAARLAVGDLRGADAVLTRAVAELERAPLSLQLRAWLLEARLADDRGNRARCALLVERTFRAAAAEDLWMPVRREWRWLRALVVRDPALRRDHRDVLRELRAADERAAAVAPAPSRRDVPNGQLVVPPLTEREAQVLELLAQMYSTDEIAVALYVSANTVKTHLKGIFGKLCVNRRVDAVRRGRQLGLC
jgi:ATP/maltotriose-dependent transcriptional regulator MalT